MNQKVNNVTSEGFVKDGKIISDPDFYHYLTLFEGHKIVWKLEEITEKES